MSTSAPARHPWKFYRIGGLDQPAVETGADLLALADLDQKLWVALACPVKGLEIDEKTLALIDADADGRIRAPELIAAIKWAAPHLRDVGELLAGADTLPLAALDDSTAAGKAALAAARRVLTNIGKPDATAVSLADLADTRKIIAATPFNGDGVIPPAAAGDPALATVISEIIACLGAASDRSGDAGIDQAKIEVFFADLAAFAKWKQDGASSDVLPLGERTASAAAAIAAVRSKVDDYFARSRLAAFDARALATLNGPEASFAALAPHEIAASAPEIAALPLARIEPGRALPLGEGVNPAWAGRLTALLQEAVTPILGAGHTSLTPGQWRELQAKVAPYEAWTAAKAGASVERLGLDRVNALLAGDARAALTALVERDKALAPEFASITDLEKLLRLRRDLRVLVKNFVNFTDFYSPDQLATFQAGTLFLDSRSTELCVAVAGPSPLAAMSKACIAYCDCRRAGQPGLKIAACFTQGDSDYLFVGRNGVFYDRQGRDWDATITSIVDNPISLRQAFWSPYKKFVRLIEEQVAKRAAAAEAASSTKLQDASVAATNIDQTKAPPPAAGAAGGPPRKVEIGTVAAIGVAISGAITALTLILGYVFKLTWWQYPLLVLGLVLVISAPSVIIAWLKLRQRTLGPILDANGWAINGRVKINIPFGTQLTSRAELPPGSRRSLDDPYADKAAKRRWWWSVALVVLLAAAAVGVRVHRTYFNDGYYFWQEKPVPPVAAPEAGGAGMEPAVAPEAALAPTPAGS